MIILGFVGIEIWCDFWLKTLGFVGIICKFEILSFMKPNFYVVICELVFSSIDRF